MSNFKIYVLLQEINRRYSSITYNLFYDFRLYDINIIMAPEKQTT